MNKIIVPSSGEIRLQTPKGELLTIQSPWSQANSELRMDRIMPGNYLYIGYKPGTKNETYVYFLHLQSGKLNRIAEWLIDAGGRYVTQIQIDSSLSSRSLSSQFIITPNIDILTSILQKYANDLQIYQFLRYILDNEKSARSYIDSLGSIQKFTTHVSPPTNSKTHSNKVFALVIYNHNYARNLAKLQEYLNGRFSDVTYIFPNVAPQHAQCLAFPYGSYQYHLGIYEGLRRISAKGSLDDWCLLFQDDVLLHPKIDQTYIASAWSNSNISSAIPNTLSINHNPNDGWFWNDRIELSCTKPRHPLFGNGFEGLDFFSDHKNFSRGVSDIFAIKFRYIDLFLDILGFYIAQNVFPEVAIPTALRKLASDTHTHHIHLDGIFLWGSDRAHAESETWIKDHFINSTKYFLHPFKISNVKMPAAFK